MGRKVMEPHNNEALPAAARNKASALLLIESGRHRFIELCYKDGGMDIIELSSLCRKYNVSVMWRGQEAIAVESFNALKRGLLQPKKTFRRRLLYCMFDLSVIDKKEVGEVENMATLLGDLIIPGELLLNPYIKWQ